MRVKEQILSQEMKARGLWKGRIKGRMTTLSQQSPQAESTF
jgi:hypothetical protein